MSARAKPPSFVVAAVVALFACDNPIVDQKIEALGGEAEGTPVGPYHRPGQPCVLCHSVYFGAEPELVIGGTVFVDRNGYVPVEGAKVVLYDAVGDIYELVSNCNGNFYREKSDLDPQFPLYAEVHCPEYDAAGVRVEGVFRVKSMASWISRDGSCAGCHGLNGRQVNSTGWIVCNEEGDTAVLPPQREDCPGKPPKTGDGTAGGGGS
jgi:hypothetical protein